MRSIFLTGALACGAACADTTAPPAAGWTVYSELSVWQASDAVPISQLEDEWSAYSPRNGRNTFLMRNKAAAGVEKNGWRLGLELRQDAYLDTDRATLDAVYMYQQKQKPAPGASFALQGRYFSWRAQGLRLGHRFAGPRIAGRPSHVELSGAVYGQQRLRERSVHGTLTYPRADTYGFSATHTDTDSRMTYPFMGEAPSAAGAGLSLAAAVPLGADWTLHLQADDFASKLRWKRLPVNTESLRSDVASYDENGYVNYQPMLSGRKRQVERSFRIPRYTAAALGYRYQNWDLGVRVVRYADETIPTLSLARRFGWLTLHGNVETRFDSAGIGLEAGDFRFQLQSDKLNLDKATTRSLQLHYRLIF